MILHLIMLLLIGTHLITANFVVCSDTNDLFRERSFVKASNKAMPFMAGKSGFKGLLSIVKSFCMLVIPSVN